MASIGFMGNPTLPIADMHIRHPGLTQAIARTYYEAATVCLDRHHPSPTTFCIEWSDGIALTDLHWEPAGPSTRAAYANTIDVTEAGAYGVCLAALEQVADLVAIQRAETLTGADYYVAPRGSAIDDLETALRFEVSGVDKGRRAICDQRLTSKVRQTEAAQHPLPAIAAVTGFQQKVVLLSSRSGNV